MKIFITRMCLANENPRKIDEKYHQYLILAWLNFLEMYFKFNWCPIILANQLFYVETGTLLSDAFFLASYCYMIKI